MVPKDLKDPPDPLGLLARTDPPVRTVLTAHQDQQGLKDRLDRWAPRDPQEQLVPKDLKDPQGP